MWRYRPPPVVFTTRNTLIQKKQIAQIGFIDPQQGPVEIHETSFFLVFIFRGFEFEFEFLPKVSPTLKSVEAAHWV